ncbi:hypothetical protein PMAYCL1PPCAC_30952, partial [Pristionchus mayeri]
LELCSRPHSAMMLPTTVVLLSILTTVVHSFTAASGCLYDHFQDPSVKEKCEKHLMCENMVSTKEFECNTKAGYNLQYYSEEKNEWMLIGSSPLTCVGRILDLKVATGGVITHSIPRWLRYAKESKR